MSVKLTELIRRHQAEDGHDERYREFDPDRFDYTVKLRLPDGSERFYRNPEEKGGEVRDKAHNVPATAKILAVGTAFWDWKKCVHSTVGIDVDTDHGHRAGLKSDEFHRTLEAAKSIPWLYILWSSGGEGLHIFPKFRAPVPAALRAEGAALASAVIERMTRESGHDFHESKDCAGGNLWIFKADAAPNAYKVLKEATEELDPDDLPVGWREAKRASKTKVKYSPSCVKLEQEHERIAKEINDLGYSIIWVADQNCFHIHTHGLERAHEEHRYHGHFRTVSEGTDPGKPNGYMYPLPGGGFLVKRFGDAREDDSWFDGPGGQYALFNVNVPIEKAAQHFCLAQSPQGYVFDRGQLDVCLAAIGMEDRCPEEFKDRKVFITVKPKELHLSAVRCDEDPAIEGWVAHNKMWQKVVNKPRRTKAEEQADHIRSSEIVRAVATDTESAMWCVCTDGRFIGTSASEARKVLSTRFKNPEKLMGELRLKPYILEYKPFQPEYLPGRLWNRDAPQLACEPADDPGDTPTWDAVFDHIGRGLDEAVKECEVCREAGITSGSHYLRLWVKLLITRPEQRTPYLFLTSRQNNTGKSSFGFALGKLIDPGVGEISAEALSGTFTGELEGKVLCLIEELDLRNKGNKAYQKIKNILTSKTVTVRRMRTDAYNVPNYTHFVHTANDARFVPCETEDTRIVMVDVSPLSAPIEALDFDKGIEDEAPSMLRKLLDLPLPKPKGRFWLPVLQTALKEQVLSGLYDDEDSEVVDGVKEFAKKKLVKGAGFKAPTSEVLQAYRDFCGPKNPGEEACFPTVHDNGFLKLLKAHFEPRIDRKQRRVDGGRAWHYIGVKLK